MEFQSKKHSYETDREYQARLKKRLKKRGATAGVGIFDWDSTKAQFKQEIERAKTNKFKKS